jgi:hypothetical protein
MALAEELREMAQRLAGAGWTRKFEQEWTPAERTAYEAATDEEHDDWFQWMMDEPIHMEWIDVWTEREPGPSGRLLFKYVERWSHKENVLREHTGIGVVNEEEKRWGDMSSVRDEAWVRENWDTAMPSERARYGVELPPERPYSGKG